MSGFTTLFKAFGTPLVGDRFLIYGNYHGNITGIFEKEKSLSIKLMQASLKLRPQPNVQK